MSEHISQPYANFFELVMGLIPEARKLLQHFVDAKLVDNLDLDTLELAHGSFKGGETGLENFVTDMLYTCQWKGEEIRIDILLEHKSWLANPKQQILGYLMDGYKRQRIDWRRAKEEAKQKNEPFSTKPFKYKLIIPIIFYHGKQRWKDYAFADQFKLPEEWLKDFIPDVKIFVIDMNEFTDAHIESIGASFLQPMLYLFKHKEDKDFIKQNKEKIFNFVEELQNDEFTKKYLRTIFYFMIQTFKLKKEEVTDIAATLPTKNIDTMEMVQNTVLSCIDEAMLEGVEKGEKINEIKNSVETILMFSQTLPEIKDSKIALICKVRRPFVTKVRKIFLTDKEAVIKRFVRTTYKNIPSIREVDFLKLEKISITLWKEFKKNSN